jgi:hypothetical protein
MITAQYLKKFLLDSTDWTQVVDNDLTAEEKEAWVVYRQALRNLDSNVGLFQLSWPIPPGRINPLGGLPQMSVDELYTANLADQR